MTGAEQVRCPICGRGTLRVIDFDGDQGEQQPGSREVQSFTCGHEVTGARLDSADADRLDVERRSSEDTTMQPDDEAVAKPADQGVPGDP
jgi:hypothetical protein